MTGRVHRPGDRPRPRLAANAATNIARLTLALSLFCCAVAVSSAAQAQDPSIAPPPSDIIPLPAPFTRQMRQDPENPLAVPGGIPAAPDSGSTSEAVIGGSVDDLPVPVKTMRDLIMKATRDADYEALRPLIGVGANTTQLSLGGYDGDPIEYIKGLSGDPEGYEILAILEEVLEAGYAVYDKGTPAEMYVWPYFVATSLDELTPKQRVELFKLVTSGDYEDMRSFGAYVFYRVGIMPDGKWRFFVAGE
ncbi:MAG: hypothetical protein WAU86_09485 [Oricola sp.]